MGPSKRIMKFIGVKILDAPSTSFRILSHVDTVNNQPNHLTFSYSFSLNLLSLCMNSSQLTRMSLNVNKLMLRQTQKMQGIKL